jgi:hypothetical protein
MKTMHWGRSGGRLDVRVKTPGMCCFFVAATGYELPYQDRVDQQNIACRCGAGLRKPRQRSRTSVCVA